MLSLTRNVPILFACVRDERCVILRNTVYWFRGTTLVVDLALVREMRHAYEILVRRPEKKRPIFET
jgi:hypothetical protein